MEEKPRPLLDESGDDDGSDGDDASSSGSSAATSADAPDLEPEIASVVVSVEPEEFHRPRFMKNPSSNLDKTDYFFSIHSQKLYYQGYVYKKNEYGSDGKPLTKQNNIGAWGMTDPCGEWLKWWAELVGHTLYLWRVPDSIASMAYEPEPSLGTTLSLELSPSDHILQSIKAAQDKPLMMNLLDVSSELFSHKFRPSTSNAPPPPVPYTSFFGLSTSGSNLFLFASPSYIASNAWVGAARLAAYEASHINTVFSLNLLRIPPYMAAWSDLNIPPFYSAWYKGEIKFSGPLAVRHAFQDSWKPCFCVITQVKYFEKVESENAVADPASVPSNKRLSKFFGGNKKKTESPELSKKEPSLIEKIKGQVLFFESKAEYKKGSPPFMTIEDGTSANALWPERLEAAKADRVTHVRIRGKVTLSGKTQDPFSKSKNGTERPQSIFGGLLPKIGSPSFSNAELPSTSSSKPPSPSHVLLQCANTHESLHWLVGILGVFHIDADIDLCDVHSALWLDPPPDWGELCLTTDEIAGFSTLVPPSQTLLDFSRLLRDKKALLKAGLFKNWAASVQHGVEQRKKYELREVEVKARELIAWVEKIKTGPVKLPAWVENELSFTFDELNEEAEDSKEEAREMLDLVKDNTPTSQPAASPKASSIQSSKKTSVDNPKVASKANGRKLSADGSEKSGSIRSTQSKALDNSDKPTSIHSKTSPTRSVAQESETGSMVEEKKSIVSIKSEKSNTSAKSSHKNVDDGSDSSGDEKSSKGSSSSDTEKAKKSKTAPPSVFKPDAYKQSSPAFSFQERQSNSSPKTKEEKVKKFVLDLTLTAPMDFKSDVTESTTWYKEEQDRLKIREKWLAGMDIEVPVFRMRDGVLVNCMIY